MANAESNNSSKKPKRKLRAAPTLREQALETTTNADKPSRKRRIGSSRIFAPFRALGRLFKKLGRSIAGSRFGQTVKKVAKSRALAPVRFIGRILSKILLIRYFRESWQELKLVVWPTNKTTWRLTLAVILFAIVFGALVAALDFGFERLFRTVILKA